MATALLRRPVAGLSTSGWLAAAFALCLTGFAQAAPAKKRIFVVDSFHREALWSRSTQEGLGRAMLKYGYLDDVGQLEALAQNDRVESAKAIVRKAWMDTKRHGDRRHIARATAAIMQEIRTFRPDLVMLGDDPAAKYIGNQLLDTAVPVVFWGINGLPLKYGLVDSMDSPGHNVTGVWQSGYYKQSLELLKALVPKARTFAILSGDSPTARSVAKQIQTLDRRGELPLELTDTVLTGSYATFRERALALSKRVDAFFVLSQDTLHDEGGRYVSKREVGRWYLSNVRKPEAAISGTLVRDGLLLAASDSGYNQGYLAFEKAYDILEHGLNPGQMRTSTPPRGPLIVNRERARMLGIPIDGGSVIIEEIVERASVLGG